MSNRLDFRTIPSTTDTFIIHEFIAIVWRQKQSKLEYYLKMNAGCLVFFFEISFT